MRLFGIWHVFGNHIQTDTNIYVKKYGENKWKIDIYFSILYLRKNCPRANTCNLNIKIDRKSCGAQSHLHNDYHYWSLDG